MQLFIKPVLCNPGCDGFDSSYSCCNGTFGCDLKETMCNGGCPASNYDLSGSTDHVYMMCRYAGIMKRVADWWKGELDKQQNPMSLIKELETEVVDRILAIERHLGG